MALKMVRLEAYRDVNLADPLAVPAAESVTA